jgi:pimeloyl-ACP methyl ester carboxylesterase
MKLFLALLVLIPFNGSTQISGNWHGSFSVMGNSTLIDMRIVRAVPSDSIVLTDPSGKFANMMMNDIELTDSTIVFKWTQIGLKFEGNYFASGDSIYGIMTQRDIKWDVSFHREAQELKVVNRPQTPKAPFAFTEERVTIINGDITLGATLMMPRSYKADLPVVVLASGTGAQDRDCDLLGHKYFFVIADHLAKHGIASLRFDDRGVGESGGNYQKSTLEDFGSDVKACVAFLAKQKRFKKNLIGIAGHSEGGMHALIAAKGNCKVDFIIELASLGTSGKEVLVEQQYLIPKQSGGTEELARWNSSVFEGMCDIVMEFDYDEAIDTLGSFLEKKYDEATEEYRASTTLLAHKLNAMVFINNEWARQFSRFQSADYLKKIKVPLLCINGGKDIQVPAASNSAGFKNGFSKKSAKRSKVVIVPGINHLFQECTSCTILEYGELEETISPVVLMLVSDWVNGLYSSN